MAKISEERKNYILEQMLPPYNLRVPELAKKEGIPLGTLYDWRAKLKLSGVLMPGKKKTTEKWSNTDKLQVIIETSNLSETELSEYCRCKGLYKEQITQWKNDFQSPSFEPAKNRMSVKEERVMRNEIKNLKRELRRKEKALAEASAIILLRKKLQALYGEPEEEEL